MRHQAFQRGKQSFSSFSAVRSRFVILTILSIHQTLKVSASNMPVSEPEDYDDETGEQPTSAILLPSFTVIENLKPSNVAELITRFVDVGPTNGTRVGADPVVSSQEEELAADGTDEDTTTTTATTAAAAAATTAAQLTKTTTPTTPPTTQSIPHTLQSHPCPHDYLILLCSHKTRDLRCGISAPLLAKEFERHLRPLGLYRDLHDTRPGGVGIYFINHVGGHKFAANVIVYRSVKVVKAAVATAAETTTETTEKTTTETRTGTRREVGSGMPETDKEKDEGTETNAGQTTDPSSLPIENSTISRDQPDEGEGEGKERKEAGQCIWLARVRPADCENIVKYTVLQGKVVKPKSQLRGGFDRVQGLVSW